MTRKEAMQKGRIIKIVSSQYTIDMDGTEVIAGLRGRMRRGQTPVVGDFAALEQIEDTWRVSHIEERRNRLLRPAIANVDQALIVTSAKDPDFSVHLMDRLIFLASMAGVEPVIVLTKSDKADELELAAIQQALEPYRKWYTVLETHPGSNDDELRELLKGKVSVLCGQSGAGKSSLLNRLDPSFKLRTQEISKALGRGKHTTRHTELHPVAGGLTADTPGFSSMDFARMDLSTLAPSLAPFQPYLDECRFNDCAHLKEPDCAVKAAVEAGEIPRSLYEDYAQLLEETPQKKY